MKVDGWMVGQKKWMDGWMRDEDKGWKDKKVEEKQRQGG